MDTPRCCCTLEALPLELLCVTVQLLDTRAALAARATCRALRNAVHYCHDPSALLLPLFESRARRLAPLSPPGYARYDARLEADTHDAQRLLHSMANLAACFVRLDAQTLLYRACEYGASALVRALVQLPRHRVRAEAERSRALRVAVQHSHRSTVLVLLEDARVDPTASEQPRADDAGERHLELDYTALYDAAVLGDVRCAHDMLAYLEQNATVMHLENDPTHLLSHCLLRLAPFDDISARFKWRRRLEIALGERILASPLFTPAWHRQFLLCAAADQARVSLVRRLLEDPRADPAAHNCLALRRAYAKRYESEHAEEHDRAADYTECIRALEHACEARRLAVPDYCGVACYVQFFDEHNLGAHSDLPDLYFHEPPFADLPN